MKSILAEIIIQSMEFFGLAADSDIDPDVAVRQLEYISSRFSRLKELSKAELDDFFAHVEARAERLRLEGAPREQLDFLRNLREYSGVDVNAPE